MQYAQNNHAVEQVEQEANINDIVSSMAKIRSIRSQIDEQQIATSTDFSGNPIQYIANVTQGNHTVSVELENVIITKHYLINEFIDRFIKI